MALLAVVVAVVALKVFIEFIGKVLSGSLKDLDLKIPSDSFKLFERINISTICN